MSKTSAARLLDSLGVAYELLTSARVLALVVTFFALTACSVPPTQPFTGALPAFHDGARIVVVGDLQRTSFLEFWRESNDPERALVVQAIANAQPDLLAITGDCVFNGGMDAQWADFDELMTPIRARNPPVIAAFGNHEYWAGRAGAEAYLFPRVPLDQQRHWFYVALGPLRIVVADSNQSELADREWSEQARWFERSLDAFDHDPTVRGVLVMMHHSPYSNSTVTGDDEGVQQAFVPPFLRAKKTLAMLTGHVHNYERFLRGGKMFVVSGGGGGPRAKLAEGDARRHTDDLFDGPPLRDFHFIIYTVTARGLDAEVRGVPKGGNVFATMDRFALPWAALSR